MIWLLHYIPRQNCGNTKGDDHSNIIGNGGTGVNNTEDQVAVMDRNIDANGKVDSLPKEVPR